MGCKTTVTWKADFSSFTCSSGGTWKLEKVYHWWSSFRSSHSPSNLYSFFLNFHFLTTSLNRKEVIYRTFPSFAMNVTAIVWLMESTDPPYWSITTAAWYLRYLTISVGNHLTGRVAGNLLDWIFAMMLEYTTWRVRPIIVTDWFVGMNGTITCADILNHHSDVDSCRLLRSPSCYRAICIGSIKNKEAIEVVENVAGMSDVQSNLNNTDYCFSSSFAYFLPVFCYKRFRFLLEILTIVISSTFIFVQSYRILRYRHWKTRMCTVQTNFILCCHSNTRRAFEFPTGPVTIFTCPYP